MRHILRNPIGEALAAVGIAWAEVYGRFRDWCEPDRIGAWFDPCPDFPDPDSTEDQP